MLLGLETFSYHLAFAYGKMDIFDFIRRSTELGLDGVQINVEGDDLGHLGNDDPGFLKEVRALIESFGMFVELDTCNTDPANLARVLTVCRALGADVMRVYASIGGNPRQELFQAAADLKQMVGLCADYGIKIALENHEHETSGEILEVVRRVDSPWVGTHIDTGNSMMVWEQPLEAIAAMAPYAVSTHFKDHLVIMVGNQPMIVGVPLGRGAIDCEACFRILAEKSPLTRINIEVCYGYIAPFRVPQDQGPGAKLGQGCFRVHEPPYDRDVVAPHILKALECEDELQAFNWQNLARMSDSDTQRRELMVRQDKAVVDSVEFVKGLNR